MSLVVIDVAPGETMKRGDLVHTNVGDRRERTWIVIKARRMRRTRSGRPQFEVWMERWWKVDSDLRIALGNSAERNGGQRIVVFNRQRKKKVTFEQYMRRF